MPPKKQEPVKKKAEPPKELCGCGVNTYRAPPKGKKKAPVIIEHAPGCSLRSWLSSLPSSESLVPSLQ